MGYESGEAFAAAAAILVTGVGVAAEVGSADFRSLNKLQADPSAVAYHLTSSSTCNPLWAPRFISQLANSESLAWRLSVPQSVATSGLLNGERFLELLIYLPERSR